MNDRLVRRGVVATSTITVLAVAAEAPPLPLPSLAVTFLGVAIRRQPDGSSRRTGRTVTRRRADVQG